MRMPSTSSARSSGAAGHADAGDADADGGLGAYGPADVHGLGLRGQLGPAGHDVGDGDVAAAVEHDAEGVVLVVLHDEHDRAREEVREHPRRGDEEHPGLGLVALECVEQPVSVKVLRHVPSPTRL